MVGAAGAARGRKRSGCSGDPAVAAGAAGASNCDRGRAVWSLLVAAPLVSAYAYDQMTNTEGGLRARIADRRRGSRIRRNDRAQARAGDTPLSIGRMQAERDAVVASRDEMTRRLQELLANTKIGGEVNVNITAAPGIQANADLQPNDGTRMTGNVGRAIMNTD